MIDLYSLLISPFVEFAFMRHALVASMALALGCAPIGIFLVLRRMSLMGDAMSHAILPGVSIAFLTHGLSLWAMSLGGLIAGLIVALLSGVVSRMTQLKEDTSLAAFYLMSLAAGVLLISLSGNNVDLMHILFGSVLAVDSSSLVLVAAISSLTLILLALFYRPLVLESFDSEFMAVSLGYGAWIQGGFLVLVVLNLVAGFQAMGTLMSVGLMMIPAATARLWTDDIGGMLITSWLTALLATVTGLICSYHFDTPSGPTIILLAGSLYLVSVMIGKRGGILWQWARPRHLER